MHINSSCAGLFGGNIKIDMYLLSFLKHRSLKPTRHHIDDLLITGCTQGCHNDNLGCNQWWEGCQYFWFQWWLIICIKSFIICLFHNTDALFAAVFMSVDLLRCITYFRDCIMFFEFCNILGELLPQISLQRNFFWKNYLKSWFDFSNYTQPFIYQVKIYFWPCFSIMTPYFPYKNSHHKDKTVSWLSYLYYGNPHIWKDNLYMEMSPFVTSVTYWLQCHVQYIPKICIIRPC